MTPTDIQKLRGLLAAATPGPWTPSNTAVPKLCDDCAKKMGACRRCGGTREWPDVSPLPVKPKKPRRRKT